MFRLNISVYVKNSTIIWYVYIFNNNFRLFFRSTHLSIPKLTYLYIYKYICKFKHISKYINIRNVALSIHTFELDFFMNMFIFRCFFPCSVAIFLYIFEFYIYVSACVCVYVYEICTFTNMCRSGSIWSCWCIHIDC